jgi:hypothetical protein
VRPRRAPGDGCPLLRGHSEALLGVLARRRQIGIPLRAPRPACHYGGLGRDVRGAIARGVGKLLRPSETLGHVDVGHLDGESEQERVPQGIGGLLTEANLYFYFSMVISPDPSMMPQCE